MLLNYIGDIGNNNGFRSFKYKAKILESAVAVENKIIMKNATNTVPRNKKVNNRSR